MAIAAHKDKKKALRAARETRAGRSPLWLVCEANGLPLPASRQAGENVDPYARVEELQLFLTPLRSLEGGALAPFRGLRTLDAPLQSFESLRGLEACPLLERLWLNDNKIASLDGLQNCTRLRELYLAGNRLEGELGPEDALAALGGSLDVLDVSRNVLAGVDAAARRLGALRALRAAGNRVGRVPEQWAAARSLEELDLSGNRVAFVADLRRLGRQLPALRVAALSSDMHGDNPVCRLPGYRALSRRFLSQCERLDTVALSPAVLERARAAGQAHRMAHAARRQRLRSGRRLARAEASRGVFERDARVYARIRGVLAQLAHARRTMEALQTATAAGDDSTATAVAGSGAALAAECTLRARPEAALRKHQEAVRRVLVSVFGALDETRDEAMRSLDEQLDGAVEETELTLRIEYESGGSVAIERGHPDDEWYAHCAALLQQEWESSRAAVAAAEGAAAGEAELAGGVELTYAFRVSNHALRALLADEPHAQPVAQDATSLPPPLPPPFCLVLTDRTVPGDAFHKAQEGLSPGDARDAFGTNIFDSDLARLRASGGGGGGSGGGSRPLPDAPASAVVCQRLPGGGLLPRFIVGFHYVASAAVLHPPQPADGRMGRLARRLGSASLAFVVADFLDGCSGSELGAGHASEIADCVEAGRKLGLDAAMGLAEPEAAPPAALERLTFAEGARAVRPERLVRLALSGLALGELPGGLAQCVNLEKLDISFNRLRSLGAVSCLPLLRRLDASHNPALRDPAAGRAALSGLPSLTSLDLSQCAVDRLEAVASLASRAPGLRLLDLRGNEIAYACGYRRAAARAWASTLQVLDSVPVGGGSDDAAGDDGGPTVELLEVARAGGEGEQQRLVVSGQRIASIAGAGELGDLCELELDRCARLRTLDLGHAPAGLEVLSCRDGSLSSVVVPPLPPPQQQQQPRAGGFLSRLARVDVSGNRLASLAWVSSLPGLVSLCASDNEIRDTRPLASCPCLVEVYLAANAVSSARGVVALASLAHLQVLDLSGNPISRQCGEGGAGGSGTATLAAAAWPPYRSYVLYRLRKLRVLDGAAVSLAEHQAAREEFAGRLTEEDLCEAAAAGLADVHDGGEREAAALALFYGAADAGGGVATTAAAGGSGGGGGGGGGGEECAAAEALAAALGLVKRLDLRGRRLRTLRVVDARLSALEVLNLTGNALTGAELAGVRLPRLVRLVLNENRVTELPALAGLFPRLRVLEVNNNRVASLEALGLRGLGSLNVLSASGNEIAEVEGVGSLANLEQLVLSGNRVRGFSPSSFAGLLRLRGLQLDDNSIKSFRNFGPFPALQCLFAGHNRVSDLRELVHLSHDASGAWLREVSMAGNNVARRESFYFYGLVHLLPAVEVIDGRMITEAHRASASEVAGSFAVVSGTIVAEETSSVVGSPGRAAYPSVVRLTSCNLGIGGGAADTPPNEQQQQQQRPWYAAPFGTAQSSIVSGGGAHGTLRGGSGAGREGGSQGHHPRQSQQSLAEAVASKGRAPPSVFAYEQVAPARVGTLTDSQYTGEAVASGVAAARSRGAEHGRRRRATEGAPTRPAVQRGGTRLRRRSDAYRALPSWLQFFG